MKELKDVLQENKEQMDYWFNQLKNGLEENIEGERMEIRYKDFLFFYNEIEDIAKAYNTLNRNNLIEEADYAAKKDIIKDFFDNTLLMRVKAVEIIDKVRNKKGA